MDFTGERFIPSVGGDIRLEHLHRYYVARRLVAGRRVLDIACGEGYGSDLLAQTANSVIGVDLDEDSIAHARMHYQRPNIEFKTGSATEIPLESSTVDVVVSFETIEHLVDHQEMMMEIKRVLTDAGVLIISSPDKKEYSDVRNYKNPFHLRELHASEFHSLLNRSFANVKLLGQRIHYASIIAPFERDQAHFSTLKEGSDGAVVEAPGLLDPLYIVAVASDQPVPDCAGGIFIPHRPSYWDDIALLRGELQMCNERWEAATKSLGDANQQPYEVNRQLDEAHQPVAQTGRTIFQRASTLFQSLRNKVLPG